jgi:hypothetical protein
MRLGAMTRLFGAGIELHAPEGGGAPAPPANGNAQPAPGVPS